MMGRERGMLREEFLFDREKIINRHSLLYTGSVKNSCGCNRMETILLAQCHCH